jgi:RNA polymerase sigma factor (sigma-70 family)
VQATFVDAIQHPARWDERRPLAPWLVGILANHVRVELRRRQRHATPDPQRLRGNAPPAPLDAAAANELAAAVHQALARLPRQYHQVLALRFVHGLELAQIAASLRLPLGTVKTRLYRGAAELKRGLPVGLATALAVTFTPGRGLAAVRELVLAKAGATTAAVGAGSAAFALSGILGVFLMKPILLAAGLALAASVAFFAWPGSAPTLPPGVAASAALPPEAASVPGPQAAGDLGATNVPASASLAAARAPFAASSDTGGLLVRCRWQDDATPAANIDLQCSRDTASGPWPPTAARTGTTAADGTLRFDNLAPGSWSLATSTSLLPCDVVAGRLATVDLAFADYVQLHVRVRDGADRPVVNAIVMATDRSAAEQVRQLGQTDAQGELVCRRLSLDTVFARCADFVPSRPVNVAGRQGRVDVSLVLDTVGCALQGVVVDPQGRPVADAEVLVGTDDYHAVRSGHDHDRPRPPIVLRSDFRGAFACSEVLPGEHTLIARTPTYAPAIARLRVATGTTAICTLGLRIGAAVSGRVTDRSDRPLVGARVTARESQLGFDGHARELVAMTAADGSFRLAPLAPGQPRVTIRAPGLPEASRRFELGDGATGIWNVRLPEGGDIAGIVRDADGGPLVGWRVRAMGSEQVGADRRTHEREATTGADGRFTLEGLVDEPFTVEVFAPDSGGGGIVRARTRDVRPSTQDLELRVADSGAAPGWIVARIVRPTDVSAQDARLEVTRAAELGTATFRLAADRESTRLGPLPPGDYTLTVELGHARLQLPTVHLAAGETVALPALRFDQLRPVSIRLRDAKGRPVANAKVALGHSTGIAKRMQNLDPGREPGDYVSQPVPPGPAVLLLRGSTFAVEQVEVTIPDTAAPTIEHVVRPGAAVSFHFVPPGSPPKRWRARIVVDLRDALGTCLLNEPLGADGEGGWSWPIQLGPGSYTIVAMASPGGNATVPFTVTAAGPQPQVVEVPLAK